MVMELKGAGSSLDSLVATFNARVSELQELAVARNMYPAKALPDLSAIDATLTTMESQIQVIRDRLQAEREAIPKVKKFIELSQRQQRKLQHMASHLPPRMHTSTSLSYGTPSTSCMYQTPSRLEEKLCLCEPPSLPNFNLDLNEEPAAHPRERKGRGRAPRWYITAQELDSLSSYMRGRLTLDKVNMAINDIGGYADATAQLIANTKKKMSDEAWKKVLEVKDIAKSENIKGKHFFLESDIKGPILKLDNTGKAILTVLRHLGRMHEHRIGPHRVFTVMTPQ